MSGALDVEIEESSKAADMSRLGRSIEFKTVLTPSLGTGS